MDAFIKQWMVEKSREEKEKKSFEPDSNQRPMDNFTTTVHRSTN